MLYWLTEKRPWPRSHLSRDLPDTWPGPRKHIGVKSLG